MVEELLTLFQTVLVSMSQAEIVSWKTGEEVEAEVPA